MTTNAAEVLRAAGWFEGRRVPADVTRWEEALSTPSGYSLNEHAREFLLEFGGLCWPDFPRDKRPSRFLFDLDPMRADFEEDRFRLAEADAGGERLFPVGEVLNGYYFLAVRARGSFYLVMDDVERCGEDAWTAFGRLINPGSSYRE